LITVTWSGRLLSRTKFTAVMMPLKPPPTMAMHSGADFGNRVFQKNLLVVFRILSSQQDLFSF
jgi:hypothetical protein